MSTYINLDIRCNVLEKKNNNTYFSLIGNISEFDKKYSEILSVRNISDFSEVINNIKGFFAIIINSDNKLLAAVDHSRSIPLYYAQIDEDFYLSTSACWIQDNIKDINKDKLAEEEFQMLGYVLGNKTLYPNIKQLQAGECLTLSENKLEIKKYYNPNYSNPIKFDKKDFFEKLDNAAINSVKRLIDYADGRQIIVPLSGGYDSRLIASLLRRLKYKNVVCFSYGIKANKEAEYSKKIADALGYKWIFIEYTDSSWSKSWFSLEAEEFRKYASNLSSLPHIQDWLALTELKKGSIIESSAIFVPGHCCVTDFIPDEEFLNKKKYKKSHLLDLYVDYIIDTHFIGRPFSKNSILTLKKTKKILAFEKKIKSIDDALSEIIKYNWKERQEKYITNSVRSYEFMGYGWWLPLWDQEFMRVWEAVPLKYRIGKSIYKEYVNKQFHDSSIVKLEINDNASDRTLFRHFLSMVIPKITPKNIIKRVNRIRIKKIYENHFLRFGSLISEKELNHYVKNDYNIIGMYSDLFLKDKWGKNKD